MKLNKLLLVLAIVALTVVPRLKGLAAPVADWHSFRQSDTAAVARNFIKFGLDPLHPRYDDLSNIQSGKDNPMGWRMVEFPLYQTIATLRSRILPGLPIEVHLRLTTIVASVITAILLFLILDSLGAPVVGGVAGFVYALLPYSIYFGRVILPEPLAVAYAMVSLWVLSAKKIGWVRVVIGAVFAALALLVKPTAAFLMLPAVYFLFRAKGALFHSFTYALITLVPLLWWRRWILQFPEGIPVYEWLLNANNIRFKGAWFWWLFAKRIGELILGFWGLILLGLGLITKSGKEEKWFTWLLLAGTLGYLVVFAAGNVQHDYYQILLLPGISIMAAKGIVFLWSNTVLSRAASRMLLVASCIFAFAFSWYTIRTYWWINRPEIVEAGRAADAILPKDAKVIASYNGDTTFLYQINRQGWPLGFDIDEKIAMGATHYVTVSPTDADGETKDLASRYTVLVRNDRFAIIDLTAPRK
jgi:hypothetical protein